MPRMTGMIDKLKLRKDFKSAIEKYAEEQKLKKQLKEGELVKTPVMKLKKGKDIQKYEEGGVVETKQYAHSSIDKLINKNG